MKHEDKNIITIPEAAAAALLHQKLRTAPAAPLLQKPHLLKNLLPVVQRVTHTVTAAVQIQVR